MGDRQIKRILKDHITVDFEFDEVAKYIWDLFKYVRNKHHPEQINHEFHGVAMESNEKREKLKKIVGELANLFEQSKYPLRYQQFGIKGELLKQLEKDGLTPEGLNSYIRVLAQIADAEPSPELEHNPSSRKETPENYVVRMINGQLPITLDRKTRILIIKEIFQSQEIQKTEKSIGHVIDKQPRSRDVILNRFINP